MARKPRAPVTSRIRRTSADGVRSSSVQPFVRATRSARMSTSSPELSMRSIRLRSRAVATPGPRHASSEARRRGAVARTRSPWGRTTTTPPCFSSTITNRSNCCAATTPVCRRTEPRAKLTPGGGRRPARIGPAVSHARRAAAFRPPTLRDLLCRAGGRRWGARRDSRTPGGASTDEDVRAAVGRCSRRPAPHSNRRSPAVNERILVIDDDLVVHEVARSALEREGFIVYDAVEGQAGLAVASVRGPALVVLDMMLPDVAGETILQELRRRSRVPILVLSAKGDTEQRVQGLGLGADDYLPKPFSPRELVARAKALLRRAHGDLAERDLLTFDGGRLEIDSVRHEVRVDGVPCDVARSEFDLLLALAQSPGRPSTRNEIAYRLRGHDFEGDERL